MEDRCVCCGTVIPEGRLVCPQCEAEYPYKKLEKELERLKQVVSAEEAIAAIKAAFIGFLNQWENTFADCWEQLQEWIFTIKEKIPKTPYIFKSKVRIYDKRPHKQHRIRSNCRKDRYMLKQLDIFGNEVTPKKEERPKRYKTMQQIHGIKHGETCKTCKHCLCFRYHGKTYYKCEKWVISHSSATDIRLKSKACNKWEREESDNE